MERGPSRDHAHEPRRENEPTERIEDGVWIPASLEAFADQVGVGSTTKLLEVRMPDAGHTPRLRITADAKRVIADRDTLASALAASGSTETVDAFRGRKVSAGLQLGRMLRKLDAGADPHDIIKTRLAHGADIVVVDEEYAAKPLAELADVQADGLVTNLRHRPIMVSGADCAPIIAFDPVNKAVGVFHSGWKGTGKRTVTNGIDAMARAFGSRAENVRIVVGPYADGLSYEIHKEFFDEMASKTRADGSPLYTREELGAMFQPHPWDATRMLFDNGQAIAIEMRQAGVPSENIEISGYSTMRDNDLFSSERREGAKDRDTLVVMAVLK